METRITEHGSKRYSFPLGKQDPDELIRIFERDNKLSIHFICKHGTPEKLRSLSQFVLAVKDNKLYMYSTVGREAIRGLTIDRATRITMSMSQTIFKQSGDKNEMGMGTISSVKKIMATFLGSHIDWYPKVNCNKLKMIEIIALASSKIVTDRYVHEGIIKVPNGVAQNILRHSTTLRELAKKVFGFTSPWAMEQSIKILDGYLPHGLIFKGILPVDSIKDVYKTLKGQNGPDSLSSMYWFVQIPRMRRFLKMFHKDTIINWYKQSDTSSFYASEAERWLGDTIRLWECIPEEARELPKGTNSLRRIHDILSERQRKIEQSDYDLKPAKKALAIDGDTVDGMRILIPKTNYELIEWGTQMSNCIGSYGHSSNILVGIEREGALKYCIEISNGRIWQFLARFNQDPDEKDKETIINHLKKMKVVTETVLEPVF